MPILIAIVVLLAIFFAPQLWVRYTLRRYKTPREDFPGTGGELAQHLIERFELTAVKVEQTKEGEDHYDPVAKMVRLSPSHYGVKSLTAIAVAAHEVGHAIQHHRQEPLLNLRSRLAVIAHHLQRGAAIMLIAMPVLTLLTRSPALGLIMLILGITSMGSAVVLHFITLPVEIDASFNKALPILREGNYINAQDEKAARRVLRAAALTYVAAAMASLLNLWRWLALLRR